MPRRYRRSFIRLRRIVATLFTFSVLLALPVPSAVAASGDIHAVIGTWDGGLWHAVRGSGDIWTAFGDVKVQAGDPGGVRDVATTVLNGEVHVIVATNVGALRYAVRRTGGSWTRFTDLKLLTGDPGNVWSVSSANVGGKLHLAVSTSAYGLYHSVRNGENDWTPFRDVELQTGQAGLVEDVAIAAAGAELHIVLTAWDYSLLHAIRHADGSWTAFGDVQSAANFYPQQEVHRVSSTVIDGRLYLVATYGEGNALYTSRFPNGDWEKGRGISGVIGIPGQFIDISVAHSGNRLHVMGSVQGGGLWHAHRAVTETSWHGFYKVNVRQGDPVLVGDVSASG